MVTELESSPAPVTRTTQRKPLMSMRQILLMNAGFFGIQYSFGMQGTAVNPIFVQIGADASNLPLLNLAGPMCGLLIQPLIGALSDRTWSPRWGRRKPFFLLGAVGCAVVLFLFPLISALWMAVILLWLLDASNNTAMEPYRAFLADKLDDSQLAKGFLTQSFFTGAGVTVANFSLYFLQKVTDATTSAGIPYWAVTAFWIGSVVSLGSILVTTLSTPENPPSEEELAEMRQKREGGGAIKDIASAVREMPASLHKLGIVYLFQWYAIVIYWQFISLSLAQSIFHAGEKDPAYQQAAALVGFANGTYNIVTMIAAFPLVRLAHKFGAKWVHAVCIGLAAAAMFTLPTVTNQWFLIVPMIGLGIAWASMMGVPYIMAISLIPRERYGVYMGIINMMIVVPMIIQSLTFGWIYEHLLGNSPANAMILAGVLFLCGAVAMTWIRPPKRQSPIIPLTYRQIMGYERVIVGSDGSDSALRGVHRAAEIAASSEADLVVVCAYNPSATPGATPADPTSAMHEEVQGQNQANATLKETVARINTARISDVHQRAVAADPADALLGAADNPDTDLIVVGNRGLGAEGEALLGSVPAAVARAATCDVLIVQTTNLGSAARPRQVMPGSV